MKSDCEILRSASIYLIWLKNLHMIKDILCFCKRVLYFIAVMSKYFSHITGSASYRKL